uniref:Uncharacterized protein n=1 Tax=Oryza sativa subsp. japonica TaxID=39947 RepID=Q67U64_ORYSJ|nr:hypothetical protein [Oryza sativa Japonica Group]BAD38307.1 hypothetical protein [Oryza sativa Japonica Group]
MELGVKTKRILSDPIRSKSVRSEDMPGATAAAAATFLLHPGAAAYRLHPRGGGVAATAATSCAGHLVVSVSVPATPPAIVMSILYVSIRCFWTEDKSIVNNLTLYYDVIM